MIIKRDKPTPEEMVNYYLGVLYKSKKETHRIYIKQMIGFHLKENPYPLNKVCETLK